MHIYRCTSIFPLVSQLRYELENQVKKKHEIPYIVAIFRPKSFHDPTKERFKVEHDSKVRELSRGHFVWETCSTITLSRCSLNDAFGNPRFSRIYSWTVRQFARNLAGVQTGHQTGHQTRGKRVVSCFRRLARSGRLDA